MASKSWATSHGRKARRSRAWMLWTFMTSASLRSCVTMRRGLRPPWPDDGPRGPNPDRRAARRYANPTNSTAKKNAQVDHRGQRQRGRRRRRGTEFVRRTVSILASRNCGLSAVDGPIRDAPTVACVAAAGSPCRTRSPAGRRMPLPPRRSETAAPRRKTADRTAPTPGRRPARRTRRSPPSAAWARRPARPPQQEGCQHEQEPNRGEQRQVGNNCGRRHRREMHYLSGTQSLKAIGEHEPACHQRRHILGVAAGAFASRSPTTTASRITNRGRREPAG